MKAKLTMPFAAREHESWYEFVHVAAAAPQDALTGFTRVPAIGRNAVTGFRVSSRRCLWRGRGAENSQMRTIFLRSRQRPSRPKSYRSRKLAACLRVRNERDEDYPEVEVIGPGNERDGQAPGQ